MTKKIHIDLEKCYKNDDESCLHYVLVENNEKSNAFLIKGYVIERLLRDMKLSYDKEIYEHFKINKEIQTDQIETKIENSFDYAWF
jgi:hypothetical protein